MRITARGWRRNAGTTQICEHDLREATSRSPLYWPQPGANIVPATDGVRIHVGPEKLTLGGQYQISVYLTNEDVVRLFLRCFPDLANVITAAHAQSKVNAEAAE